LIVKHGRSITSGSRLQGFLVQDSSLTVYVEKLKSTEREICREGI